MASPDDMVNQARGANQNLAKIASVLQSRFSLATFSGTFTLTATATFTVNNANVTAASIILWTPTNAAAGTLEGSAKKLYRSTRNAGANFVVATSNGVAAVGGETFDYVIVNVG